MSSHSTIAEVRASETGHDNDLRIPYPLPPQLPRSSESTFDLVRSIEKDVEPKAEPLQICDHDLSDGASNFQQMDGSRDKKLHRLLSLGYESRELNGHIKEAFGLDSSTSFELRVSKSTTRNAPVDNDGSNQCAKRIEKQNDALSSMVNTDRQRFPSPNVDSSVSIRDFVTAGEMPLSTELNVHPSTESARQSSHNRRLSQETINSKVLPACSSATAQWNPSHSSDLQIATGLTNLPAMTTASKINSSPPKTGLESVLSDSHLLATESGPQHATSNHGLTTPISSFNTHSAGENRHSRVQEMSRNREYHHERTSRPQMLSEYKPPSVPNFSHQMRKSIAHQESPIIAPKPISPARQLKLKNSIPQLMKALPPLPPEPEAFVFSPPIAQKSTDPELPDRVSHVLANTFPETIQEANEVPVVIAPFQFSMDIASADQMGKPLPDLRQINTGFQKSPVETGGEMCLPPPPPPKLKLKLRASNTLQPQSPLETHPWNLKESYPWESQDENILLPSTEQKENETSHKQPRFRLRVTRASLAPQGAVRIHRNSGDEKLGNVQLRAPNDLFSPTSGIESVFRRVSSHIHSRRTSTASSLQAENEFAANSTPESLRIPLGDQFPSASSTTHLSPKSNALLCEAQSCFSDDSSQEEGENGLRRRLTSLKSRIPVPYVSRAATQSHDDITWKDRNGGEQANPVPAKLIPNTHGGSTTGNDARPMQRLAERLHRQKLRTKMQGWLKGARNAIAARVRTRSTPSSAEVVQGNSV